jgi:hypothetical protein
MGLLFGKNSSTNISEELAVSIFYHEDGGSWFLSTKLHSVTSQKTTIFWDVTVCHLLLAWLTL